MDSRWSPMKFLRSAFHVRHETKLSSWLPPVESWEGNGLPYGWESAIDKEGKIYYINHTNRTTTHDSPARRRGEEAGEEETPREVQLVRDPQAGFGFVAGSEKPVIVRFVTEGGPNEKKLMPGDQILKINGEDVMRSPREHVIELIRSCKQTVNLLVCQPQTNNTTRKSALLTAAKKAKLKNNPSKVRFSEGITINGSPLFSPTDGNAPFLPNVLKVFLENGQTKSFKYDTNTTVQDVLNSLFEKLSIKSVRHFCLATEHVKITRKNRLTILDPKELLAKIASKPGAHHLRCVLRVSFVPRDAQDLLKKDPVTFEYLYMQCCNDVVEERFTPELRYDVALRLTAVHMQQHCLDTGVATAGKVTLKAVERACGLERFVPSSLLEGMRGKELRKLLSHFLKASHKISSPLHAKLYLLRSVAEAPSYGAKCFPTNITDSNPEMTVLVSPRFGISQISCSRGTTPVTLCRLEEVTSVEVQREDEWSCLLHIHTRDSNRQTLTLSLEEKDAEEFVLMLAGYHRLLCGKDLEVEHHSPLSPTHLMEEIVPPFHSRHMVHESAWSYPPPPVPPGLRTLDLTSLPPPYTPCEVPRHSPKHNRSSTPPPFDHNMNETAASVRLRGGKDADVARRRGGGRRSSVDERHPGVDYRTSISMELLEGEVVGGADVDVDVHEARNDELIRRLAEVERMVADAHSYLAADAPPPGEEEVKSGVHLPSDDPAKDPYDSYDEDDEVGGVSPLRCRRSSSSALHPHHHPMMRRDSSFGLHSPDVLPDVAAGQNILDILRDMREAEAEEAAVCLDPDLIDLTAIPPPATPEVEEVVAMEAGAEAIVDPPPGVFDFRVERYEEAECGGDVTDGGDNSTSLDISLESLLASLSPPEKKDEDNEEADLSVYIIPPPPTSSPGSAEAQEAVIARFVAAAEDIRTLFMPDNSVVDSSLKFENKTGNLDHHLDSSSSSSSGYDTLPSCDDSASFAVPARLRTSCVEEENEIEELLSPSSTASSDSSVVLLRHRVEDDSSVPPLRHRVEDDSSDFNRHRVGDDSSGFPRHRVDDDSSAFLRHRVDREEEEADVRRTGSCDDLLRVPGGGGGGIVRSVSWGSMEEEEDSSTFHTSASLRQNRLRRSFHRPNRPTKCPEGGVPASSNGTTLKYLLPPHQQPTNGHPLNGLTPAYEQAIRDIASVVVHLRKIPRSTSSSSSSSTPSEAAELTSSSSPPSEVERAKVCAARDVLANESRRFVSASKLFVRGAMEAGREEAKREVDVEALSVCSSLLNRMCAVGEAVAARIGDSRLLLEGLEAVALAHLRTVEAAREAGNGRLMQCATALATALTALMRTLRTI